MPLKRHYEEGGHQAALFEWANLIKVSEGGVLRDYMWGSMNGAKRSFSAAGIAKIQGNTKGVPDVSICLPRRNYHGMFLELKREAYYKITAEQHVIIDRLNKVGYCARVSNTIDKSIEMIEEYLK